MKNSRFLLFISLLISLNYSELIFSQTMPQVVWSKLYNAPSNLQDSSVAISMNSLGMVFVTGWSYSPTTSADIATIRYNPSTGDTIWAKRYIQPNEQRSTSMTCDNNAVYVTGWSFSTSLNRDVLTIKYNAATGDTMWVKKYDGPRSGGDYGLDITNDAGYVYVTGRLSDAGATEYQRFYVLKYDKNTGAIAAGFPYIYRDNPLSDEAHSIKVDNSGNIYITGQSNFSPGPSDMQTLKISSTGTLLWAKIHNDVGNSSDYGVSLVLDNSQNNVYVAGWGVRIAFSDYIVLKYNTSTGDNTGYVSYNGTNGTDFLKGMVIDASDNIYVTGWSLNHAVNRYEIATIKYNSALQQQWATRTFNPDGWDIANALTLGTNNDVYVAGSRSLPGQGYNILTLRYDASTGSIIWQKMESGSPGSNDHGSGIVVRDNTSIFMTASIVATGGNTASIYTARYSNQMLGINPVSSGIPQSFSLGQNYPNPFNPVTKINFDLPENSSVKLVVYDITGKVVYTFADNINLYAGTYEAVFDATHFSSGVYLYKLTAGNFSATRKMILLR